MIAGLSGLRNPQAEKRFIRAGKSPNELPTASGFFLFKNLRKQLLEFENQQRAQSLRFPKKDGLEVFFLLSLSQTLVSRIWHTY